MANCINPECRNGLVPGVRVAGRGTHDGARPGATMRWQPVACPACRPQPKGPAYVPIARSEDEIAERWNLAKLNAPFRTDTRKIPAENGSDTEPLLTVKSRTPTPPPNIPRTDPTAERIAVALEKLVARIEILTGAVLERLDPPEQEPVPEAPCNPISAETKTAASDSPSAKKRAKGNSARKRGGNAGKSIQ